ncbi:MAG TPA: HEAT repeat domain-containing protein [Pyrinomonadaceae bacterium]|nr:HEAT repeat domain-containing protein [Pyrinomonadaceae bacterium]
MSFLNVKKRVTYRRLTQTGVRLILGFSVTFSFILASPGFGEAQRLYMPAKITEVSARPSAAGTVVTISADSNLSKAQTWHDDEGYHVVLPDTVSDYSLKLARGVKLRRVGSSLEVLLQTKAGSRVSMQSVGNQISLAVDGNLVSRPTESTFQSQYSSPDESRLFESQNYPRSPQDAPPVKFSTPVDDLTTKSEPSQTTAAPVLNPSTQTAPASQTDGTQIVPQGDGSTVVQPPPSTISVQAEEDGFLSSVFSGTSVLIVLALGLFGLLVSQKIRSKQTTVVEQSTPTDGEDWSTVTALESRNQHPSHESRSLVRASDVARNGSSRSAVARTPVAGPVSLYGAYRIDQEVGKLLLGQPHRIDVLSSRAIEDRRAIETSLIKGVNGPEFDESSQRRAREALEEYGFVARQCATLLLAPDAFDRSSAAQSLGEIKSAAALPFLLESLYDSEAIVRNQAVVSIGELKLPSAIGALLDIARTHPDVPSALLSRTLSACSVEGLDFFDAIVPETALLGGAEIGSVVESITQLEPAGAVENLPQSDEDERLALALSGVESADTTERSEALKVLVQFRVQSAVDAIAHVARYDTEPAIRSLAIAALGSIDHESVFTAVVIGMADETREVRAAAARSLTRLSFDRADAYVRVIESGDEETIQSVAKACTHAGIVSQNLDRLANSDHRQAYETFSLICLLSKANMNEPVLDAIANHPHMDVRLKAVHLLACTRQTGTFDQLRELALRDGISELVKTALLEAMYKIDQVRLQQDEGVERAFEFHAEPELTEREQPWTEQSPVEAFQEVNETMFAFSPSEPAIQEPLVVNETSDSSSDFEVTASEFEYFVSAVEQTEEPNNQSTSEPASDGREF